MSESSPEKKFDPQKHLSTIRTKQGEKPYLTVMWRVAWLRDEFPEAMIETKIVEHQIDSYAVAVARVDIPGKGAATSHGMAKFGTGQVVRGADGKNTVDGFPEYLEKAETKAVGRACALLGYGTQFAGDELDEGETPVDSPRPARSSSSKETGELAPSAKVGRARHLAKKIMAQGPKEFDENLKAGKFGRILEQLTEAEVDQVIEGLEKVEATEKANREKALESK
jgi:hypothetical protein